MLDRVHVELQFSCSSLLIASRNYINYGLGALLALRISHTELGLMREGTVGVGRPVGYYGTQAVMLTLGGYLAYLVKDYWQMS